MVKYGWMTLTLIGIPAALLLIFWPDALGDTLHALLKVMVVK